MYKRQLVAHGSAGDYVFDDAEGRIAVQGARQEAGGALSARFDGEGHRLRLDADIGLSLIHI